MLRLLALLAALSAAALAGLAGPSAAAAPCWKELINDWLDGRIDHVYPVRCYREALRHLPTDIEQYSSARDDINRALAARIAGGPPTGGQAGDTAPPPAAGGGKRSRPGQASGKGDTAPGRAQGGASTTGGGRAPGNDTGAGPAAGRPGSGTPAQGGVAPGRNPERGGPVGGVIREVGPDSADEVPIPLLVLGSLAVLLVLLGSAGFLARRLQARRAVRPAPESRAPKP